MREQDPFREIPADIIDAYKGAKDYGYTPATDADAPIQPDALTTNGISTPANDRQAERDLGIHDGDSGD
jgi:hypothetical protein